MVTTALSNHKLEKCPKKYNFVQKGGSHIFSYILLDSFVGTYWLLGFSSGHRLTELRSKPYFVDFR